MFLKSLELSNFRNYKHSVINFDKQKTLFIGQNAQGKTNILEAIYYLSCLNSKRASKDSELMLWGEDYCRVYAEVEKSTLDVEVEFLVNPPKKKQLKLNGIKKNKSSEFLGNLVAVNFCVDDLLLLRGAPSDRRSWIDDCISRIYPGYLERLQKYNKIRTHRNNLLKSFKGQMNHSYETSLEVWDEQLIIAGSNLTLLRLKYLDEIKNIVAKKHNIIAHEETLSLLYNSTILGDVDIFSDYKIEDIAQAFKEKIKENRTDEVMKAQTLVGSHRDDVGFFINGKNALNFASQGQQRTIVLSLKLAEIDIIRQKIDDTPVLLLDDVLAELDSSRQNFLLKSIGTDIQTIITSTDVNGFEPEFLEDVKIYKVSKGQIETEGESVEIS